MTSAPYDRIIATCVVPEIPAAWLAQLDPGGRIVTDLRGEMSSSLAVLDHTDPGTVTGSGGSRPTVHPG